jgi:hypothetical protein
MPDRRLVITPKMFKRAVKLVRGPKPTRAAKNPAWPPPLKPPPLKK